MTAKKRTPALDRAEEYIRTAGLNCTRCADGTLVMCYRSRYIAWMEGRNGLTPEEQLRIQASGGTIIGIDEDTDLDKAMALVESRTRRM